LVEQKIIKILGGGMTPEELRNFMETEDLLTQQELAQMLGVSQPTVCDWLAGEHAIPNWVGRFTLFFSLAPVGLKRRMRL
jgi:DNA-binding transcriptional regulator YiaG